MVLVDSRDKLDITRVFLHERDVRYSHVSRTHWMCDITHARVVPGGGLGCRRQGERIHNGNAPGQQGRQGGQGRQDEAVVLLSTDVKNRRRCLVFVAFKYNSPGAIRTERSVDRTASFGHLACDKKRRKKLMYP